MFLTPNDFTNQDGELSIHNERGYSFVFFFVDNSKLSPHEKQSQDFCKDLRPYFDKLRTIVKGVRFYYMDVDQNNRQIVKMAERTKQKIMYVPLLYFFSNGKVIAQYFPDEDNPENNLQKMIDFILATTNSSRTVPASRNGLSAKQPNTFDANSSVPPYSIGIPGNFACTGNGCKPYNSAYPVPK
jgi:hypothetical protein